MNQEPVIPHPGRWTDGNPPPNVRIGQNSLIQGTLAFKRFNSLVDPALVVGDHCTIDGVQFAAGAEGRIFIGDYCYLSYAVLLAELEIRIGSYVVVGWNTTIADSDFHPMSPAERIADAIACSPLGKNHRRPPIAREAVVIEDDVWIGPNVSILKGVRIGTGAFIEPGALVTRDIPPGSRVLGNPAQVTGSVDA